MIVNVHHAANEGSVTHVSTGLMAVPAALAPGNQAEEQPDAQDDGSHDQAQLNLDLAADGIIPFC